METRDITKVLSQIVEKDLNSSMVYNPPSVSDHTGVLGLPEAFHRNVSASKTTPKKRSLFGLEMEKRKALKQQTKPMTGKETITDSVIDRPGAFTVGQVISDVAENTAASPGIRDEPGASASAAESEEEQRKIHEENIKTLMEKSPQDIEEMRTEILGMLNPSTVAFLKARQQTRFGPWSQAVSQLNQSPVISAESCHVAEQAEEDVDMSDEVKALEKVTSHKLTHPDPLSKLEHEAIKPEAVSTDPPAASVCDGDGVDLPVTMDTAQFVHMNVVEQDKLKWIDELPPPPSTETRGGENQQARFNFQGELLDPEADLPLHLGLHHHGEEQEKAGYSLGELFQLSRSAFIPQRVMALNTLAAIINNARHGRYNDRTSIPLLPAMLDGGLVFILRWALDDPNQQSMLAAVRCMHALLICKEDHDGLARVASWPQFGPWQPWLAAGESKPEPAGEEDGGEEEGEQDAEVLKRDVIEGLIQMNLIPRVRYILSECKPNASSVQQLLDILTVVAMHCPNSAFQVFSCAGLLDIVIQNFIPMSWQPLGTLNEPITNTYNLPTPKALVLLRNIAVMGRNMAANLSALERNVMQALITYTCSKGLEAVLPDYVVVQLQVEAFHLWRVFLGYGLGISEFVSMFQEFRPMISRFTWSTEALTRTSGAEHVQSMVAFLSLLQTSVKTTFACVQERLRQRSLSKEELERPLPAVPSITWCEIQDYFLVLVEFIGNRLKALTEAAAGNLKNQALETDAVAMECLATFLEVIQGGVTDDVINYCDTAQTFAKEVLLPFVRSLYFTRSFEDVKQFSVFTHVETSKRTDIPKCLPDVGALVGHESKLVRCLRSDNPLPLCTAVIHLMYSLIRLNKAVSDTLTTTVLQNPGVQYYVTSCLNKITKSHLVSNFFNGFENTLQFYILELVSLAPSFVGISKYYKLGAELLIQLQPGQEVMLVRLLQRVIFNKNLLQACMNEAETHKKCGEIVQELSDDTIKKYIPTWRSASAGDGSTNGGDGSISGGDGSTCGGDGWLTLNILENSTAVCNTYLREMEPFLADVTLAGQVIEGRCFTVPRLAGGRLSQTLLPLDWPYLPILRLHADVVNGKSSARASGQATRLVDHSLNCSSLLETLEVPFMTHMSPVLKLSRLACIFLIAGQSYQETRFRLLLLAVLKRLCLYSNLRKMNFNESIPGLASFYELYSDLLVEFAATSYGDPIFSTVVLLPLQQVCPVKFRLAVWEEHTVVTRLMTMRLDTILVPLENFLDPDETNSKMILAYVRCIASRTVVPGRNPLLYLIAVHHINRFIYTQDKLDSKLKKTLARDICNNHNYFTAETRKHLLFYKRHSLCAPHGLELYSDLPPVRQQQLQTFGCLV